MSFDDDDDDAVLRRFNAISLTEKAAARRKSLGKQVTTARAIAEAAEKLELGKPMQASVHGVVLDFYPIRALARSINRTPQTIRLWEAKGVIPLSRFRAPAAVGASALEGKEAMGRRLYTRQQIVVVVEAAKRHGVMNPNPDTNWEAFTREVVDGWQAIA